MIFCLKLFWVGARAPLNTILLLGAFTMVSTGISQGSPVAQISGEKDDNLFELVPVMRAMVS